MSTLSGAYQGALPASIVTLFDASVPGSLLLSGQPAVVGGNIDTAGVCTQGTSANQPFYDDKILGSGPAVSFGGNGAAWGISPWVSPPVTSLIVPSQAMSLPLTVLCVFRCDGAATIYELSTNASSAPGVSLRSDGSTTIQATNGSGTQTANAASTWATDNTLRWTELYIDGVNPAILNANGSSVTLTPGGVAPGTGAFSTVGTVGSAHSLGSPIPYGAISYLGYVLGALSASDRTAFAAYVQARWSIPATSGTSRNVTSIGDSIMSANGVVSQNVETKAYSFVERAAAALGTNWSAGLHNFAVSGAEVTGVQVGRDIPWQVSVQLPTGIVSGVTNVVLFQGGINDINQLIIPSTYPTAVTAAATILAGWQTQINAAAAQFASTAGGPHHFGIHTVTFHAQPSNPYEEVCRQILNDGIRANYLSWGGTNVVMHLLDIANDILGTPVGSYNNSTHVNNANYFTDIEHPSKAGEERWAGWLMRQLLSWGL